MKTITEIEQMLEQKKNLLEGQKFYNYSDKRKMEDWVKILTWVLE